MRLRTKIVGAMVGTVVAAVSGAWAWLMTEPKPKKRVDDEETTALLGVVFPTKKDQ